MLDKVTVIHFSPTGNTRKAACMLGQALAGEVAELDLTEVQLSVPSFHPEEVVVIAAPSFGGRIPAVQLARLQALQGNGAQAILLAVYGNRAYEDVLVELQDCVQQQGFRPVAAASLVAQHSMVPAVAAGRPDAADQREIASFADALLPKLQKAEAGVGAAPLAVPGNRPYKAWTAMPVVPMVTEACVKCGLCAAQCPVGAIPAAQLEQTDAALCMLCMRCISICPQQARLLPPPAVAMIAQKLEPVKDLRQKNEFFMM